MVERSDHNIQLTNFSKTAMRKFIARIRGIDPFYSEILKNQVDLYQKYFARLLNTVDIENSTKRSRGEDYDSIVSDKDNKAIEKIIVEEAQEKDNLLPVYLQVILEQYFYADVWEREKDKYHWVNRVLHRKKVDYFPDPMRIYTTIFA